MFQWALLGTRWATGTGIKIGAGNFSCETPVAHRIPNTRPGNLCWTGKYSAEVCCDPVYGPQGDLSCWDGTYTFQRCCGSRVPQENTSKQSGSMELEGMWCPALSKSGLQHLDREVLKPNRVLVGIIASTRAERLTFKSLKENVLDVLDADLALAVSVRGGGSGSQSESPLRAHAKYIFEICDPLHNNYTDFVVQVARLCSKRQNELRMSRQETIQFKAARLYRLNPRSWFRGFISHPHKGSEWFLMFYRWLLLQGLKHAGALNRYRALILTRSDLFYLAPHPPVPALIPTQIMVPEGGDFAGIVDKHQVMSMAAAVHVLGMLEFLTRELSTVVPAITGMQPEVNFEKVVLNYLMWAGITMVSHFPRTMFVVTDSEDSSRHSGQRGDGSSWASKEFGQVVKYESEYHCAKVGQRRFRTESWALWTPHWTPIQTLNLPRCEFAWYKSGKDLMQQPSMELAAYNLFFAGSRPFSKDRKKDITVLEAGAKDGFEGSETFQLQYAYGFRTVLLEEISSQQLELFATRPRARIACIPDANGSAPANLHDVPQVCQPLSVVLEDVPSIDVAFFQGAGTGTHLGVLQALLRTNKSPMAVFVVGATPDSREGQFLSSIGYFQYKTDHGYFWINTTYQHSF